MMPPPLLLLLLLTLWIPRSNEMTVDSTLGTDQATPSSCSQARNCQDCQGRAASCAWCFHPDFNDANFGPGHRCAPPAVLMSRGCPNSSWESVTSQVFTPSGLQTPPSESDEAATNQLKPARQTALVRPFHPTEIVFNFTSIRDYPVDLYHLTDISFSMRDNLDAVSRQAEAISATMGSLTKRFRIGFGAFVDKPVAPFVFPKRSVMLNPCELAQTECDPPFLYKHLLSLTHNITRFKETIKNSRSSANLDAPEGGLDALLQVAHCKSELNWSKGARKIVLFTTDGPFHVAGDGKLAGLVRPPPTTCQLSYQADRWKPSLKYTGFHNAIETDYPSVGELARVLSETDMYVIFATSRRFAPLYERLAALLPSATVGIFQEDSRDIVKLLRDNYFKIVSTVALGVVFEDIGLKIEVLSRCDGEKIFSEKKTCTNLPLGGTIEFKLRVTSKTCFAGTKTVQLHLFGLKDSASAKLEVKSACECSLCKQTPSLISPAKCNEQGDLTCGVCNCRNLFSGDFCECGAADTASVEKTKQLCIRPDDPTKQLCSGRGRCHCGKCNCFQPRYTGAYCGCDREGCKRASDDNKVCGGPERGVCTCSGQCKCRPGYTGERCDCMQASQNKCRDPKAVDGKLCSGKGQCDCGVCWCDVGWTGLLCNEREGGEGPLCTDTAVKECVLCLHRKEAGDGKLECARLCNATVVDTGRFSMVHGHSTDDGSNLCVIYDERDCRVYFTYRYSDDVYFERKVLVRIQTTNECPTKVNFWLIIGGVVGGIVGIGIILLLIWKLVVTIDDRRELAKFQKETANARWEMEENPIFKAPVTTVTNPLYTGID